MIVLGHFPAYIELAASIAARAFIIPPEIYDRLTPAERWEANRRFIDTAIVDGSRIVLATSPTAIRPGSVFEQEMAYMIALGFTPVRRSGRWEMVR